MKMAAPALAGNVPSWSREGDWNCPACGDIQFSRNSSCRRCGAAKPQAQGPPVGPGGVGVGRKRRAPSWSREGDWHCPSCNDIQFARNDSCRRCGAKKPGNDESEFEIEALEFEQAVDFEEAPMEEEIADDPPVSEERPLPKMQTSGSPPWSREGDWNCPACGDIQFARNDSCRQCGAAKPHAGGAAGGGAPLLQREGTQRRREDRDWVCNSCGDLQFARNVACRRCAAAKPRGQAGTPSWSREGDWNCPSCGDIQFSRNETCRQCGAAKPQIHAQQAGAAVLFDDAAPLQEREGAWSRPGYGDLQFARDRRYGAAEFARNLLGLGAVEAMPAPAFGGSAPAWSREGDWNCLECGDIQFARNESCRKCGAPNPYMFPPVMAGGCTGVPKPQRNGRSSPSWSREGDWNCPSCGDIQFGRNESCRQCGTAKPLPVGAGVKPLPVGAGVNLGGPGVNLGGKGVAHGPVGSGAAREGDWLCPSCGDLQFARNDKCRRCSAAKPRGQAGGPAWSREGDWNCQACGDIQFARNESCRQCGTPRNGAPGPRHSSPGATPKGPRTKPGDWTCPVCGDLQFGRNAACRMCSAPKPDEDTERQRSRSPRRNGLR